MIANIIYPQAAERTQTGSDYQLSSQTVVLHLQDGTARLLDLGGNFYALSQTASEMLSATLREGSGLAAQNMASTYNVNLTAMQRDLHAFLADLEARGLIFRPEHPPVPTRRTRLAAWLLPPLLHGTQSRLIPLKGRVWILLMLAYLSTHLFGWSATVLAWQCSLCRIASARFVVKGDVSAELLENTIHTTISKYPWLVACKERSLCCWYLLRSEGLPATLKVGIMLCPLASHCWCELGSTPFCDEAERCQQFTPVLSYA